MCSAVFRYDEDAERIESAAGDQIAVVERLAVVTPPARRLAIVIDQLIVVLNQMRRHVVDDLSHSCFFFGRLGDEVVVDCVQESSGRRVRRNWCRISNTTDRRRSWANAARFPSSERPRRPHRAVALQIVILIGIGPDDGTYRACGKAFAGRMRSSLRDVAEKLEGFKGGRRPASWLPDLSWRRTRSTAPRRTSRSTTRRCRCRTAALPLSSQASTRRRHSQTRTACDDDVDRSPLQRRRPFSRASSA